MYDDKLEIYLACTTVLAMIHKSYVYIYIFSRYSLNIKPIMMLYVHNKCIIIITNPHCCCCNNNF